MRAKVEQAKADFEGSKKRMERVRLRAGTGQYSEWAKMQGENHY